MSAAEAANLIVLVGPGFVAMQFRAWTNEGHKISDAQRLTWSVLVSLPILFALHGILRHVPWKLGTLDSPEHLLSEPFAAPIQFVAALYVVGATIGWVVGRALDREWFNSILAAVQLDPSRHRDVWRATFRADQWVEVNLKDGTSLYGWLDENTSGPPDGGRFLRLKRARRRQSGSGAWSKFREERVVLVGADSISYTVSKSPRLPLPAKPRWYQRAFALRHRTKKQIGGEPQVAEEHPAPPPSATAPPA